jgi:hypothetical protein
MIYLFYKVNDADLYMIKFILEAYENMMTVSTIDEAVTKIQISVAPDLRMEAEAILADMAQRFFMQRLDEDESRTQGNY